MAVGLDGITIVDLTPGVSGPFATPRLGQMRARAIEVERPGDGIVGGMGSGHAWVGPSAPARRHHGPG